MPELYVIEPKKQYETAKKRVCAYARVSTDKESWFLFLKENDGLFEKTYVI